MLVSSFIFIKLHVSIKIIRGRIGKIKCRKRDHLHLAEALYLHELLMSKSTCVEKLIAMRPMIQDQQLAQLADRYPSTRGNAGDTGAVKFRHVTQLNSNKCE